MAVFKSCCCCLSLRTGCIIIGVLELLGQLSNIVSYRSSTSMMFGALVGIITSALLIYGAIKRNRFVLWPWIVVNIIAIIIFIIALIMCAFASAIIVDAVHALQQEQIHAGMMPKQDGEAIKGFATTAVVGIAVVLLIVIAILTLLSLVVYSYICELREEEERQRNDSNAPPKAYNLVPV